HAVGERAVAMRVERLAERRVDEMPFGVAELARIRFPLVRIDRDVRQMGRAEDAQRRLQCSAGQPLFGERRGDAMSLIAPREDRAGDEQQNSEQTTHCGPFLRMVCRAARKSYPSWDVRHGLRIWCEPSIGS